MMKRYIKQAIVAVVFLLYLGISIGISAEPIKADVMDEDYIPGENLEGYVAYYYYLHLSSGIRDCTEDWIYNEEENSCSKHVGLGVGEYYVRVIASENNTVGAYSIKVNYQKTDDWEKENNNTSETATELKLNKTYNGNMY